MMDDAREWLEPDGLGGFAMGCADTIRTRRYHALLLSATKPPEGRMVLVADVETYVETDAGTFALSSHRYRGDVIHPDGHTRLASFEWRPFPRWVWHLPGGTRISCELASASSKPRTVMRYKRLDGKGRAVLRVRPLLAGRDYHSLHHENGAFRFDADVRGERVTWRPYDGVPAICALANARYEQAPEWYRNFLYTWDRERGLDYEEDLASPGTFVFDLAKAPAALAFAPGAGLDGEVASELVERTFSDEIARRAQFPSLLHRAAAAYIVARGSGLTIIAGYPWFADWGRDTFVSLRGMCLATRRRDVARGILLEWASAVSDGMLPNRYGENDAKPEYNSVDAALWFVIAADAFLAGDARDDDRRAIEQAIEAVVAGYARGTRHHIGVEDDALLAAGEPGIQLTWMDAKVNGEVITPRIGKPVEVQALWINALVIAGRKNPRWRDLAERARASFSNRFWNASAGQLYDVVDCDHVANTVDATCRPNQLFAIGGLPMQILDGPRARSVVDAVERVLWTPSGPRSIAADDPRYHGRYTGDQEQRDRAYHNGPTWPWLAGPFVEAWVRVRGNTPDAKREARAKFLVPLLARLELQGFGHLSEICDGDPPHRPVGCPFQAWSVAEALRLDHVVLANEA